RRIAHVVKAVEERDQIEILLRIFLGGRDLEASVCRDPVLPGMCSGVLDRTRMKVVANELRVRKGLRHDGGGPAMTASDIGHFGAPFQLSTTPSSAGSQLLTRLLWYPGRKKRPTAQKKQAV